MVAVLKMGVGSDKTTEVGEFCIIKLARVALQLIEGLLRMLARVVVCLFLVALAAPSVIFTLSEAQHGSYYQWKSQYARSYENGEVEAYRLTLWLQNYNRIEAHNARYSQGKESYSVALNHFADMPKNEISEGYFASFDDSYYSSTCSTRTDPSTSLLTYIHTHSTSMVFDQISSGVCGSGWAMAVSTTLGIIYSDYRLKTFNTTGYYLFSPQQLIDCATGSYAGNGCGGGSVYKSWLYYKNVGGVLNSSYPYVASQTACNSSKTPIFSVSSCISVNANSEVSLRNAVALSPVVVQLNGDAWGMVNYSDGIYDGSDCDDSNINHAMTVYGFDYEIDFDLNANPYNQTYWVAANSFGVGWGQSGSIRLLRSEGDTGNGVCGIYLRASYPI